MKKGLILGIVMIVAGLLLWQNNRSKIATDTTANLLAKSYIAGALLGVGTGIIFITYHNS